MKKTLYIFSILFIISLQGFSQDVFPDLKKIEVDKSIFVYFKPSECLVLNKIIPNESKIREVNVLVTRLMPAMQDSFLVTYNEGPSADPCFVVYRLDKDTIKLLHYAIDGKSLFIPGNGFLYVSGHTDNMYDSRRKFKVMRDTLIEVIQPFYYVGINSKALADIIIYSDTDMVNPVASVPKSSSVFVVANRGEYYLIKTPFGLLGWTFIPKGNYGTIIEGISFAGD